MRRLTLFGALIAAGGVALAGEMFFEPRVLDAAEQAKVDAEPVGSRGNPIRCAHPEGERAYLKRLRCPSGKPVKFERGGSVGEGPYGTMLDVYEVECAEFSEPLEVFLDMYHEGFVEDRAVPKLTIVPGS